MLEIHTFLHSPSHGALRGHLQMHSADTTESNARQGREASGVEWVLLSCAAMPRGLAVGVERP